MSKLNIVLYEPEIPGNTGNIMRTCAATDTKLHLIEPLGFSLDEAHIKRSGVNYIEHVNYKIYKDWNDFVSNNKGSYYFYTRYGHVPHSEFNYTNEANNNEEIYLIFGKESTGIDPKILKDYLDRCARIPMTNKVRALNLSNCAALVLYEALRQRNYDELLKDEPDDEGHKGNRFLEDYK